MLNADETGLLLHGITHWLCAPPLDLMVSSIQSHYSDTMARLSFYCAIPEISSVENPAEEWGGSSQNSRIEIGLGFA